MNTEKGTLSGYRVLDLTDQKGMFCAKLLADMGAEVIRTEKPGISPGRLFWENLGKYDITLNLESRPGQGILKKLVKTADVVVESFQPGYLGTLGLDYPALSKINPRLIMASITGFGQDGPYRDYKATDIVASASGGQMYVCGEADSPPLKPFGNQAYYTAGLFAANGILLAMWHRHTSGRGQYLDISIHESVAASLDHVLVRFFYEGVVSKRQGGLYWNNAFRVFRCRDGYILLSLFQHWETLMEWLNSEGMAEDLTDPKYLNSDYQLKHAGHIIAVLEHWTQTHTAAELVEKGQLLRFPWAKVTSVPELMDNPQLAARDFWVEIEYPRTGRKYKFPGPMAKLSRSPWQVGNKIPAPGQHNTMIYRDELSISEEELEALTRQGVI